jgi:hypothetical protein
VSPDLDHAFTSALTRRADADCRGHLRRRGGALFFIAPALVGAAALACLAGVWVTA